MHSHSLNTKGWGHRRPADLAAAMAAAAMGTFAAISMTSAAPARSAVPHDAQQCSEPYSNQRDPSNPLALPTPPGADPLNGANFYVPGPRKGAAAGAIASLGASAPGHARQRVSRPGAPGPG
jgi:hypothetical protein